MRLRFKVLIVISVLMVSMMSVGLVSAASPSYTPTVTSSPNATWYNNTPYSYITQTSQPTYFQLKTNSTLQLMYPDQYNTSQASVYGHITTRKQVNTFYINITLINENDTKVFSWQNYTLTVYNKPYIYSDPESTFIPGNLYEYNWSANQKGTYTFSIPSWMSANVTSHIMEGNVPVQAENIYTISFTLSNSNGTITQTFAITQVNVLLFTFEARLGSTIVNISSTTSPIEVTNTTIMVQGMTVATFSQGGGYYNLSVVTYTGTPSVYTITANSISDSSVILQWQGLGTYQPYVFKVIDHGSVITQLNITSSASGSFVYTYNPATMPLDPTFELAGLSSPVNPPPTPVSNTFLYLEIGLIALLSVGLVIPLIIRRQHR